MRTPDDLIARYTNSGGTLTPGTIMFGGTLPAIGGIAEPDGEEEHQQGRPLQDDLPGSRVELLPGQGDQRRVQGQDRQLAQGPELEREAIAHAL